MDTIIEFSTSSDEIEKIIDNLSNEELHLFLDDMAKLFEKNHKKITKKLNVNIDALMHLNDKRYSFGCKLIKNGKKYMVLITKLKQMNIDDYLDELNKKKSKQ